MSDAAARKALRHGLNPNEYGSRQQDFGQENFDIYWKYANDERCRNWQEQSDESEAFYFGKQITPDEEKGLKSRGQVMENVNRVHPLVEQWVSRLTAQNPAFTAIGVTDDDNRKSWLFQEYIAYSQYEYYFPEEFSKALFDMAKIGQGSLIVWYDPTADKGLGDVRISYLTRKEVYYDPDAQASGYTDSENIIVTKIVNADLVYERWPHKRKQIQQHLNAYLENIIDARNNNRDSLYNTTQSVIIGQQYDVNTHNVKPRVDKVRLIERYKKVRIPVYTAVHQVTGKQRDFTDMDALERFLNRYPDDPYLVEENIIPRVVRIVSVVDAYMEGEILPVSEYPIVPFVGEYMGNPFPIGRIQYIKGLQRLANKCLAVVILNAQTNSNSKILVKGGSLTKTQIAKLEDMWARPGAIIDTFDDLGDIQIVQGSQLNSAFFTLVLTLWEQMEYVMGLFSLSMGDPSNAPRTAQATREIHQFGSDKIQLVLRGVDMSLTRLGRVFMELTQANVTSEKVIRLATDEEAQQEKRRVLQHRGLVDPSGAFRINQRPQNGDLQVSRNSFMRGDGMGNLEVDEDGQLIERFINDLSVGEYDVRVVPASYMYTNRLAQAQLYMELYSNSGGQIVDAKAVRDKLDLKDREAIEARLNVQAQLKAQLEGAIEEINTQKNQITRLMTKDMTKTVQVATTKQESKVREKAIEAMAEIEIMLEKFQAQLDAMEVRKGASLERQAARTSQRIEKVGR